MIGHQAAHSIKTDPVDPMSKPKPNPNRHHHRVWIKWVLESGLIEKLPDCLTSIVHTTA
jgi:hypothetical protein